MLKIIYEDGSTQIVQPKLSGPEESRFDGDWEKLAFAIAEGRRHTFKIITL